MVSCSEAHDRNELTLPGKQEDLLMTIRSATQNPMIVVVMSGGPVDISWAKVRVYCAHNYLVYFTVQC